MADESLFYFCKYVLGYKDMALLPHWELCQFLEQYAGREDCLVLLPRGTFKSSIITVGFVLWRYTKNRNLRTLIDSGKLANARNWLGLISQHVQFNRTFRELYGAWDADKRTNTWHQSAISFSGRTRFLAENSITIGSPETSKVSQHYDWIICDDIQNEENVKTREMVDRLDEHIQLLLPILDPQESLVVRHRDGRNETPRGPRTFVGTRWSFDDIYGRMIAREKTYHKETYRIGLRTLIRKALDKNGAEYFPTRFSKAYLDKLKKESGLSNYQFSCQYLNDPLPEDASIFKLSRFGWYNGTHKMIVGQVAPMPTILNLFTTIDPSLGEHADSDYTAIVTVGVDSEWNIYIWSVERGHWDADQILAKMFEVQYSVKPQRMGVESVAFQRALVWGFQRMARDRGQWFNVAQLHTDNTVSKELRIRGFEPFVTGGKTFFRVHDKLDLTADLDMLYHSLVEGQDILVDEMLRFPLGSTKDCIDALAYTPQLIFPAGTMKPRTRKESGTFEEIRKRLKQRTEGLLTIGR